MEEEKKIIRRAPAIPMLISELNAKVGRVAIVGTIVSRNQEIGSIVIDDGTGSVLVLLNNPADTSKYTEGQIVLVHGKIWGSENEIEIQGELIRDFSKIDLELYKKIFFNRE
ncbi:MAG: hypothetical protein QXQ79_01575 [Candidatus Nanoarchaeia archaeon]